MSTCMTCMLLCTSTASLESSGTPSRKAVDTNELLHERGRTEALLACRSACVDSPDIVEDDVSTLVLLSYGSSECRLLTGESTLGWRSIAARDSKKENAPERSANTDCERRRDSRRRVSLAPGRSVVEAIAVVVEASPDGFSCIPRPKEAPLRSWDACPNQRFSPNGKPGAVAFFLWCTMKVARSCTLEAPHVDS